MTVFELDHIGAWMHCSRCSLAGDGIRMYGAAYRISNPEELLERVAGDLKARNLAPEDLSAYCKTYDFLYGRMDKLWSRARAAMAGQANRMGAGRLHELNLWLSQDVFDRGLSRWVGFAFKSETEELLGCKIAGIPKKQEGLLVVPFHLRPGLMAGFGFIGASDQMSYVNLLQGHEAGVCGLPTCVDADDTKVYVMQHPLQAMRIAHKCSVEGYRRIRAVAKSPMGQLDPDTLAGMEQVSWVDLPETSVLKACAKDRNFKVMQLDTPYIWRPAEKTSRLWEGSLMPVIHRTVDETPRHGPVDFLANHLTSMGVLAARAEVEAMDLTQFERNLLIVSCTNEDLREKMKDIVSASPMGSAPIMVDKRIIVERDGKLWAQGSREVSDEMVCDVIVRIQHICRSSVSGEASLFGKMSNGGFEVEFQLPEAWLRDEPAKTLARLAAKANISRQPFLSDSIARKYLDILVRMSCPEVHSVQEHVGFDQEGLRFSLPRMCISADSIRVGVPFVMSDEALPAASAEIDPEAKLATISGIFRPGAENACYLAAMASVVSGCHAARSGSKGAGTMLVGEKGELAEYVFDLIRMDLGLESVVLGSRAEMDAALRVSAGHHVPVAIDALRSSPRLVADWLGGSGRSTLMLASPMTACSLGADPDWNFVRANVEFRAEGRGLLNSELFFPFAMQYSITMGGGPARQLLESLKYLSDSLGGDRTSLDQASRCLSSCGMINARSPGIQLMSFVNEGVEAGLFKTFTGPTSAKRRYVVLRGIDDTVSIDLTALLGQMRFYHLPVCTWTASVEHLKLLGAEEVRDEEGTMLRFRKPLWNTLVAAVKRMKSLRRTMLSSLGPTAR